MFLTFVFIFLEGEEVVAPTTFGTVRMDSINKLKYHGAYDEDMKKADFYEEEEDKGSAPQVSR